MKTILVIEDNEKNLYLLKYLFEHRGFKVIEAMTGIRGVEMALQEKPDLILMDIQLPDINGLEATRRIRASKAGEGIPIVAVTSYAMPGDNTKALAAGCSGYIEKPINPKIIVEEIEKYFNTQDY